MSEFTPDELHRHIQLSVFGRQRESHERFNQLQDALHELVDRCAVAAEPEAIGIPAVVLGFQAGLELQAVRSFVERVEKRLAFYRSGRAADTWLKNYHRAVKEELAAMEANDRTND